MRKKDLRGKEIRVIIWGRNEYDGGLQCNAQSFNSFEDSPDFYFKNGHIHYILRNPCVTWRAFKKMKHHYVFNLEGKCLSHQPKKYIKRGIFNLIEGKPYAELKVYEKVL